MAHVHHESPQERKRSLNLWLVFLVVLILIATAGLALVLILRDDDNKSSSPPSTTPTTSTPDVPEQYAKALYADWQAASRTDAAKYASADAVNQLFQFPYAPLPTNNGPVDPYNFKGCEGAAGSEVCTWAGQDNAQIIMTVRNTTGGLPVLVVQVQRAGG
jgi:hypothetical protein